MDNPKKSVHEDPSGSGHVQFPEDIPYYHRQETDMTGGYAASIGTDDGDDSEEYDWSAEEDLVDEAAKFESKLGMSRRDKWSFKRFFQLSSIYYVVDPSINSVLSFLFTSLIGSVALAALVVTPALIVHFYWYNANPTLERLYIKDNIEAWLFWAAANHVISWFLAMVIDIIPVLVRFFLSISWGHVSEHVKTRIEIYDSVKNTTKPAFYAASAYASWIIIFAGIYELYNNTDPQRSRARYTRQIESVVQFFFFVVLVWCIQEMLSHFIGMSHYYYYLLSLLIKIGSIFFPQNGI